MSTPASVQTKIADTEAGEFLPTPAKDHNASHKRTRTERAGSPTAARRSMSASPSTSPPRSRAGRSPNRETPRAGDDDREDNAGTIFVGNLNHETSERRLREYFETYGRVLSTKVVFNPETGRSKGFGFVKFEDARDADDAIADADGKTMDGRTIKCNFAKYQPHRGQPPHAFRGGRGGDFGPGYRGGFRGDFRGGFRGGRGGRFGGGPPPFREGGRRGRSRSPGRYSPGRYSPGRYSYDGEDGSPPSRSGSPPMKRRRPTATSPPRGTSPARAGRSRSPDSRSSGSYSSTGSDDSKGGLPGGPPAVADLKRRRENGARKATRPAPPAEAAPPVPPPATAVLSATAKKELVQAKRREDELTVRLAAIEAELTTLRSSHGGAQEQIVELSDRLMKSEEASKQYKKWLKAMAEYARALLGAKAAVQAAEEEAKGREEDLTLFLEQAETFLLGRDKHRRRRADKEKEAAAAIEAAPKDAAAVEAPPAAAVAAEPEEVDMQNGSWAKEEEQAVDDVSAKFKPGIKFKLAS